MNQDPQSHSNAYDPGAEVEYRTISRAAIFSIVFGILSLFGFLFAGLVFFSVLGIAASFYGMLGIRRYPRELTGANVAVFGMIFCGTTLIAAGGMHTYIYLTEVPPDHTRLTFGEIKAPKYRNSPTPRALEMNGKKVFIKGYTFPGKQKKNLSQFLLVGDFGQCCFGGDPEPSHLVKVSIKNGRKIDYSTRLRKLSGTFRVLKQLSRNDEGKGYLYEITADDIK